MRRIYKMKLGALFTGGKDSTYSIFLVSKEHEIACLLNIVSVNADSYMFHTVGSELLDMQAKALRIPLERLETEGEKEKELADLRELIKAAKEKYGIEGVVSGAIASTYQKSRVDKICAALRMRSIAPLWDMDQEKYLYALVKDGFKSVIIKVSADGLGPGWLGKTIDETSVRELAKLRDRYGINLAGEGGEYESLVLDCPMFAKSLKMVGVEKIWNEKEHVGYLRIRKLEAIEKT